MAFFPISGFPPQLLKPSIGFASNYYVKFYKAGTTIPILAAFNRTSTDDFGNTITVDKIRISEFGFPINNSGGACVPHVEEIYRIVCYRNAADADANLTANAFYNVDNLKPGLIGFVEAGGENASSLISYQVGATGVLSDVETRLRKYKDLKDYGATGNGTTDDSVAIATALSGNSNIRVTAGTYLCDGFKIDEAYQSIWFDGDVTIKASANDTYLFHQRTSNSSHVGSFRCDKNGKSGVYGLVVGPADLTDTSTVTNQNYNRLPGVIGNTGAAATDELCVVQPGPTSSSFNTFNIFPLVLGFEDTRAVWLKCPPISGSNQNYGHQFYNIRAAQNTGIDIESGYGNTFSGCNLITVSSGTSPNVTPTAFKIDDTCSVTGATNSNNVATGVNFGTNNTRDLDLGNNKNSIDGRPDQSKCSVVQATFQQRSKWAWVNLHHSFINGDGTATLLPDGWTSSATGTGVYRITHNFGHSNYTCQFQHIGFGGNVRNSRISAIEDTFVEVVWVQNDSSGGDVLEAAAFFAQIYEY